MIDGRGRARITDFGLAVSGEEQQTAGDISGTPAYMAPEQLSGEPATVQSDLYALGLVLYELFTGKKAFEAATLAEWRRKHAQDAPAPPSTVTRELDPIIERVILRCLEKEPRERPRSALSVAASLPGGDPLAAALAAGETPSPEMVAAAGQVAAMKPAAAWLCLLLVAAGAAAAAVLSPRTSIHGMTPLEKSPEILANRAREMVSRLGYPERPSDTAFGFRRDYDYFEWVERHDRSRDRWKDMADGRPAGLRFWFRESPTELVPQIGFRPSGPEYSVDEENPPLRQPGMVLLALDPIGRLIHFEAVPPAVESASYVPRSPDWAALFGEAGLDPKRFSPAAPRWLPPTYADIRAAWTETRPERADRPFRIEAAAYRGRPVYFELLGPWSQPSRVRGGSLTTGSKWTDIVGTVLFLAALGSGALVARQNLRRGRGDRRGAFRVAILLFVMLFLGWLFGGTHAASIAEVQLIFLATGLTLFLAAVAWILYVALEPLVRRHWPDALISWTRFLSGRISDPRVGRDLLVGAAAGAVLALLPKLEYLLRSWLEATPPAPVLAWTAPLLGVKQVAANLVSFPARSLLFGIIATLLFVLLRGLFRREWAAAAVLIALMGVTELMERGGVAAAFGALGGLAFVLILIRLGLLALLALAVVNDYLNHALTTDLSLWYAPASLFLIALVVALAIFAFRSTVAGQPVWGALKLSE
jgi:serine/threonine-protein kinase